MTTRIRKFGIISLVVGATIFVRLIDKADAQQVNEIGITVVCTGQPLVSGEAAATIITNLASYDLLARCSSELGGRVGVDSVVLQDGETFVSATLNERFTFVPPGGAVLKCAIVSGDALPIRNSCGPAAPSFPWSLQAMVH